MSENEFKPAWWLPGPHLQTLWPTFSRRGKKKIALRRERVELPDGDFIDLDWSEQTTGPIVLILHGLEGSVHSPYAKGMLQTLTKFGWRGVVMHFRGCSGEMNRLPRSYHSGETTDVASIMAHLRRREPRTPIAALGFSLGGNVLLKWLGETGDQNPLIAAVAISVPFELNKCADRLQQGFSRVYQRYLLRQLQEKMISKFQVQPAPEPELSVKSLRTLRDFDNHITAPMHGFNSADDYYNRSSSRQFLKLIRVPTLVLQAKDDPFMTADIIPGSEELSPTVALEVTEKGGHVGFVAGRLPWRPLFWLETRIPLFLGQYL